MLKNFRRAAIVTLTLVLSAAAVKAQALKVGIVDVQKAIFQTQEIKKAQNDLLAKYRPRQQDIEKLQNDLQQIQTQLKTPNLPPDKQEQLNSDGLQKQKQLQRLSEDLQADFNRDRQEIVGRAGGRMQDVIKKLAEQKGLDVVIDVSNTLYFKPALEMTTEATTAYDQAYPVAGATQTPPAK